MRGGPEEEAGQTDLQEESSQASVEDASLEGASSDTCLQGSHETRDDEDEKDAAEHQKDQGVCNKESSDIAEISNVLERTLAGELSTCDNTVCEPSAVSEVSNDAVAEDATNVHTEGAASESAEEDLCDLSVLNSQFRPFRDETSLSHSNSHKEKDGSENHSSGSAASTSASDHAIKMRIKRQLKKDKVTQFARRTRKHGEASLVTKERRLQNDNIKQSISAEWF